MTSSLDLSTSHPGSSLPVSPLMLVLLVLLSCLQHQAAWGRRCGLNPMGDMLRTDPVLAKIILNGERPAFRDITSRFLRYVNCMGKVNAGYFRKRSSSSNEVVETSWGEEPATTNTAGWQQDTRDNGPLLLREVARLVKKQADDTSHRSGISKAGGLLQGLAPEDYHWDLRDDWPPRGENTESERPQDIDVLIRRTTHNNLHGHTKRSGELPASYPNAMAPWNEHHNPESLDYLIKPEQQQQQQLPSTSSSLSTRIKGHLPANLPAFEAFVSKVGLLSRRATPRQKTHLREQDMYILYLARYFSGERL